MRIRHVSAALLAIFSICILYLPSPVSADCVMYDVCHQVRKNSREYVTMNCRDNKPARPLIEESTRDQVKRRKIQHYCPHLFRGNELAPELCCSWRQIEDLLTQLEVPHMLLDRCHSCFDNFAKLWCDFTCSPHQSEFVTVKNVKFDAAANASYVDEVRYELSRQFAQKTFDSCKDVKFSGSPAINMMCDGTDCTPDRWLKFMGTPSIDKGIPLAIDFQLVDDSLARSMRGSDVTPCDRATNDNYTRCSCDDCSAVCGLSTLDISPAKRNEDVCLMFSFACPSLLLFASSIIVLSVAVVIVVVHYISTSASEEGEPPLGSYKHVDTNLSTVENLGAWIDYRIERVSRKYGEYCARHPMFVLSLGLSIAVVCSSGMFHVKFTTDPIELWSSASSRARQEKHFFDTHFTPFYRTAQVIMYPREQSAFLRDGDGRKYGPVFRRKFLEHAFDLLEGISVLEARTAAGRPVRLRDVCFKPMGEGTDCLVLSPTNWFQNNKTLIYSEKEERVHAMEEKGEEEEEEDDIFGDDDWATDEETTPATGGKPRVFNYVDHMYECIGNNYLTVSSLGLSCLGAYGGPIEPKVVLGDFSRPSELHSAGGIVITLPLVAHTSEHDNQHAVVWEAAFITYLKSIGHDDFVLSFSTERSIEDEIEREGMSDAFTILISYMLMFGYVAFALGQYHVSADNLRSMLVHSKITVGICGVVIVALSVTSSIGVYAFFGIRATMIVLEAQPFLALAVGVDNIFLFVQAYQRSSLDLSLPLDRRMGDIAGQVMPSMLLSSLAECLCFSVGALSSLPAVKAFCLYASLAIFFDFLLQCTCFFAIFVMDVQREEAGRPELFCCERYETERVDRDGYLFTLFNKYYAPMLMNGYVRIGVLISFVAMLCSSFYWIQFVELGLDQKMAVPEDSYVYHHFKNMERFLSVGPPVYFVIDGKLDFGRADVQNRFCSIGGCDDNSVGGIITLAAKQKHAKPWIVDSGGLNWLDDFLAWLQPGPCCRLADGEGGGGERFCPANDTTTACAQCVVRYKHARPVESDFHRYLPYFLSDNPSQQCAKGGRAAYSRAISRDSRGHVRASHLMTYHTVLKTSSDFIESLRWSRRLAELIEDHLRPMAEGGRVRVFPYSVFYVFYEQYESIVWEATAQLSLSLAAIFVVTTILTGLDPWSGLLVVLTIACILVNLLGLMSIWSIDLNAISLVNLVMSVGISVEFVVHIVRAFGRSTQRTRVERSRETLAHVGSSVLSGITITQCFGILVLAFAHSQIFKVYYFRLFFGIVLIGAAHGLVFLPVLLSFLGPSLKKRMLLDQLRKESASVELGTAIEKSQPRDFDAISVGRDEPIRSIDSEVRSTESM